MELLDIENARMERIVVPLMGLELKSADGKSDGYIKGYGAAYGNVDQGDDIVQKGAFDEDVEECEKKGIVPHMNWNHKTDEPVGDWHRVFSDEKGLGLEGRFWINMGIPRAEQSYRVAKSNTEKGLSIGFKPKKISRDEKSGVRTIIKGRLKEVSIVPYPMNLKAEITQVKSALDGREHITVREAEEILRDAARFSATEAKSFLAKLCRGWDLQRDADELNRKQISDVMNGLTNLQKALRG
jgi:HK97 family phage prohead protease